MKEEEEEVKEDEVEVEEVEGVEEVRKGKVVEEVDGDKR
jgi:hypothetical protein